MSSQQARAEIENCRLEAYMEGATRVTEFLTREAQKVGGRHPYPAKVAEEAKKSLGSMSEVSM